MDHWNKDSQRKKAILILYQGYIVSIWFVAVGDLIQLAKLEFVRFLFCKVPLLSPLPLLSSLKVTMWSSHLRSGEQTPLEGRKRIRIMDLDFSCIWNFSLSPIHSLFQSFTSFNPYSWIIIWIIISYFFIIAQIVEALFIGYFSWFLCPVDCVFSFLFYSFFPLSTWLLAPQDVSLLRDVIYLLSSCIFSLGL